MRLRGTTRISVVRVSAGGVEQFTITQHRYRRGNVYWVAEHTDLPVPAGVTYLVAEDHWADAGTLV